MSADDFSGEGTEENPYKISSVTDLQKLSEKVNIGNGYKGKYFQVTNDIDLQPVCNETSNVSWTLIGYYNPIGMPYPFSGNLDGCGHNISNLYINKPSGMDLGLFGSIRDANITNLTLINVNISGKQSIGGLVGANTINYVSKISHIHIISNCSVSGKINGITNTGGLVGQNEVSAECTAIIINCYTNVNVSGDTYVGGLVGKNIAKGQSSNIDTSIISNCYATGNVSGDSNVGGLVGYNDAQSASAKVYVNNSTALNQYVNGTSSDVGRIIGSATGTLNLFNNYAWEGMKNGDKFFTTLTEINNKNGENVSSIQVWANKTIYKNNLKWDFITDWEIIENDNDENKYPLPYLISLGKDNSLRAKVLYLKPVYITFNSNEGTGTMDNQPFSKGVPQKLDQNIFTRTGYIFDGWSNTIDGAVVNKDKGLITIENNKKLYAVWKPNITNITLYFNNTTSSASKNQIVNISFGSDEFDQSLITPTKSGYTFAGYNSTEFGGVQVINNTLKLVQNADGYTSAGKWNNTSSSIELWAAWKPNTTQITLHFNNSTYKNETVAIDYNAADYNGTQPTYPEWIGHTFLGYNSTEFGGVRVINDTLKLVQDAIGYTSAGKWNNTSSSIELWAVWKPNVTDVKLNFNNDSGDSEYVNITYGCEKFNVTSLTKPTKTGYTFAGYNNSLSGGLQVIDKDRKLLKEVSGYTSAGKWIYESKDAELWAAWKPNTTQITLHFNNSTYKNETVAIDYNAADYNGTQPTYPEWIGHTFLGYNSTEFGGVRVINDTLKLVQNADGYTSAGKWNNTSSSIELWAVWKPNITNVTLNFNNGTLLNKTVNISYGDNSFNETPIKPYCYGCTFLGYFNESSGGVQVINSALGLVPNAVNYTDVSGNWINDTRNIVLWAMWEKIPEPPSSSGSSSSYYHTTTYIGGINYEVVIGENLTVFFNSTGGSHVDYQTNLHRGDKVKEPKNPTKDGYAFKAWYTVDAYKWDFKNDTVNKSFTLYANWTAIPEHNCCWFWIILLIIAGTVITAVIIKKVRDKKRDEDYDVLS